MVAVQRKTLTISIVLHSDQWHGEADWPPSPFRLFQALIAGAYDGRWRREGDRTRADRAFEWLEELDPPIVLAPPRRAMSNINYFVPNNDLDSVGNDPRRASKIKTAKLSRRSLLERREPIVFVWQFEGATDSAAHVGELSQRLHTFGRGIDAACATWSIGNVEDIETLIASYAGTVARPSITAPEVGGPTGDPLPCPMAGSLSSLHRRFEATKRRLSPVGEGRRSSIEFRQPPKAQMRLVDYARPPRRLLLELRGHGSGVEIFAPIPQIRATDIAQATRDLAASRLVDAYDVQTIDAFIMGRGSRADDGRQRVRFVPLPSIGSHFANPSIRRVLIEIAPDSLIKERDLHWALAGQELPAFPGIRVVEAQDWTMLRYYGIGPPDKRHGRTKWRTVTPAVLPTMHARGRVGGSIRAEREGKAAFDVVQALRHAGVRAKPVDIRLQREPFTPQGKRADAFEAGRFNSDRLYHVEIVFEEDTVGPLMIGDGRWLGLGLMRPVRQEMKRAGGAGDADVEELLDDGDNDSDENDAGGD